MTNTILIEQTYEHQVRPEAELVSSNSALTLEQVRGWADGLDHLHARIASRFDRSEPRERALAYLRGLLSSIERKNGWQLAENAGEPSPDGMQRLLNGAHWDADLVRDDLRDYVVAHLADPDAVLVVDETGFIKKGSKSVGVKRQYSGTAGRIENCQIGVFLTYAAADGYSLLDRELYLPKEWAADTERRAEAGVPEEIQFQTKPQLARQMLARALAAGVPCAWVTGDEVYGGDRQLRMWLEAQQQPFVLAVASNEPLWCDIGRGLHQERAAAIAASVAAEQWQQLSAGTGSKGPRLYDWTRVALERLTWLDEEPRWEHWLLVRRSIEKPQELAYYVVFAPRGTSLEQLVAVAGRRWTIEESIEVGKGEVGLDQYEVRCWTSWYRHITLAMLAQAYLSVTRKYAARAEREKGGPRSRVQATAG
jgi:SRSO17 transposase